MSYYFLIALSLLPTPWSSLLSIIAARIKISSKPSRAISQISASILVSPELVSLGNK